MDTSELLKHGLEHGHVKDLDTAPPPSLLLKLSERSGVELGQLRHMSLAGWVPWLLDSLDDNLPDALRTYALQFSVLLPRGDRKLRPIWRWRAWLSTWMSICTLHRACPVCIDSSADQALLLAWELPLMLSCPLHGCLLETYRAPQGALGTGKTQIVHHARPKMRLWRWIAALGRH